MQDVCAISWTFTTGFAHSLSFLIEKLCCPSLYSKARLDDYTWGLQGAMKVPEGRHGDTQVAVGGGFSNILWSEFVFLSLKLEWILLS